MPIIEKRSPSQIADSERRMGANRPNPGQKKSVKKLVVDPEGETVFRGKYRINLKVMERKPSFRAG